MTSLLLVRCCGTNAGGIKCLKEILSDIGNDITKVEAGTKVHAVDFGGQTTHDLCTEHYLVVSDPGCI